MKKYCLDCNKEITIKAKRCCKCNISLRKKTPVSDETKRKISLGQTGDKSWRYKDGRSLKRYYCKECKKPISWVGGYHYNGFCKSCSHSGPRCYNWQGGKSFQSYPTKWTKRFKEKLRDRDGRICGVCGLREEDCKVRLHIHHIDYDKFNINEHNLISLCPSCHGKTNRDKENWKVYFNERIASRFCAVHNF